MAITAPGNFICETSVAHPGETVTFTWTASAGDFDYYEITLLYADAVRYYYPAKSATSYQLTILDDRPLIPAHGQMEVYISAAKGSDKNAPTDRSGYVMIRLNIDLSETPPLSNTGEWSLEQFQNSEGKEIYPRTIVEGIFRKRDGASLERILADFKGEIGNALYATFHVATATGSLLMTAEENYAGPQFRLVNGELEVVYG